MAQRLTVAPLIPTLLISIPLVLAGCDTNQDSLQKQEVTKSPIEQDAKITGLGTKLMMASANEAGVNSASPPGPPVPNFSNYINVNEKKQDFFTYMSSLADIINTKVTSLRRQLKLINPQDITQQQIDQLQILSETYRIKTPDPEKQLALLLHKINTVPKSLILAQAANESAWGTSRFAVQGNNLFGQWCFKAGCGLVPIDRNSDSSHEVRRFTNPQESVEAYITNLNGHPSYTILRQIRQCLINYNEPVTGRALAAGLQYYSSRGIEYINEIRSLIKANQLESWAQSWWGNTANHPCSSLVTIQHPTEESVATSAVNAAKVDIDLANISQQ